MKQISVEDKVEIKVGSKLNINAPPFEPKKIFMVTSVAEDGIIRTEKLKSTMLVPLQRQQLSNFPTFMYPNQIQYPINYNDNTCAFVNLPLAYIEPQSGTNTIMFSSSQQKQEHNQNVLIKNEDSVIVEHNGIVAMQNSNINDRYIPTMSNIISVPSISVGNIPLIGSQNNQSPDLWHGCANTPSVALMPPYYQTMNNLYVLRPPVFGQITPLSVTQNKSHLKINIKNKVFNTGDIEQDNILNNIVKSINSLDEFVFRSKNSRFFVIKSFTEDNIYQSIRHGVWCSTPSGNSTLVNAYKEVKSREILNDKTTEAHVYLFFSVNGSGYFCGVAEMISDLNTLTSTSIWNQKKWQAQFNIQWLYIKDIPNSYLRHIKLENNDNRPVTNCRDATEIQPLEKGIEVLRIIHNLDYDTCLLNDFSQNSLKIDKG